MSQNPITGREESVIADRSTGIRPGGDGQRHVATYDYLFSRDGGIVGTVLMRGPALPIFAVIRYAYTDIVTVPTSGGAATIGLGFATTTDINAEDAISGGPWSATGRADLDPAPAPGSQGDYIKLSAAAGLQMTIGTAALTAGRFYVIVEYDIEEG